MAGHTGEAPIPVQDPVRHIIIMAGIRRRGPAREAVIQAITGAAIPVVILPGGAVLTAQTGAASPAAAESVSREVPVPVHPAVTLQEDPVRSAVAEAAVPVRDHSPAEAAGAVSPAVAEAASPAADGSKVFIHTVAVWRLAVLPLFHSWDSFYLHLNALYDNINKSIE